jgi:hypothetical protein
LMFDEGIRSALTSGARADEILSSAHSAGMTFMHDDAVEKLHAGLTTVDELFRVVPVETGKLLTCGFCGRELASSFRFCPGCGERRKESETVKRSSEGVLQS